MGSCNKLIERNEDTLVLRRKEQLENLNSTVQSLLLKDSVKGYIRIEMYPNYRPIISDLLMNYIIENNLQQNLLKENLVFKPLIVKNKSRAVKDPVFVILTENRELSKFLWVRVDSKSNKVYIKNNRNLKDSYNPSNPFTSPSSSLNINYSRHDEVSEFQNSSSVDVINVSYPRIGEIIAYKLCQTADTLPNPEKTRQLPSSTSDSKKKNLSTFCANLTSSAKSRISDSIKSRADSILQNYEHIRALSTHLDTDEAVIHALDEFHETMIKNECHSFTDLNSFNWINDITSISTKSYHPRLLLTESTKAFLSLSSTVFLNKIEIPLSISPFQSATMHGRHSINLASYLIWGSPRVWIIVLDQSAGEKVCDYMKSFRTEVKHMQNGNTSVQTERLDRIFTTSSFQAMEMYLTPEILTKLEIEYKIVVQRPGDLIVLQSGTYFQTINLGINLSSFFNTIFLDSEVKLLKKVEMESKIADSTTNPSEDESEAWRKYLNCSKETSDLLIQLKENVKNKQKIIESKAQESEPFVLSNGKYSEMRLKIWDVFSQRTFTVINRKRRSLIPQSETDKRFWTECNKQQEGVIGSVCNGVSNKNHEEDILDANVRSPPPLTPALSPNADAGFSFPKKRNEYAFISCLKRNKTFPKRALYLTHQQQKHGKSTKKLVCRICSREFRYPGNLRRHRRIVHGINIGRKKA